MWQFRCVTSTLLNEKTVERFFVLKLYSYCFYYFVLAKNYPINGKWFVQYLVSTDNKL